MTYTISGVAHYEYSRMGPKNPILIITASILVMGPGLNVHAELL